MVSLNSIQTFRMFRDRLVTLTLTFANVFNKCTQVDHSYKYPAARVPGGSCTMFLCCEWAFNVRHTLTIGVVDSVFSPGGRKQHTTSHERHKTTMLARWPQGGGCFIRCIIGIKYPTPSRPKLPKETVVSGVVSCLHNTILIHDTAVSTPQYGDHGEGKNRDMAV